MGNKKMTMGFFSDGDHSHLLNAINHPNPTDGNRPGYFLLLDDYGHERIDVGHTREGKEEEEEEEEEEIKELSDITKYRQDLFHSIEQEKVSSHGQLARMASHIMMTSPISGNISCVYMSHVASIKGDYQKQVIEATITFIDDIAKSLKLDIQLEALIWDGSSACRSVEIG